MKGREESQNERVRARSFQVKSGLSLENKNSEYVANDDDGCLECEDYDEYNDGFCV